MVGGARAQRTDLGIQFSASPLLRKPHLAMKPANPALILLQPQMASKDWKLWGFRIRRVFSNRNTGFYGAALLAFVSLMVLIKDSHLISFYLQQPFQDHQLNLVSLPFGGIAYQKKELENWESLRSNNLKRLLPHAIDGDVRHVGESDQKEFDQILIRSNDGRHSKPLPPIANADPTLPPGHPCQDFTLPPPPADKKRTGPRPCPVCYLPVKDAVKEMPHDRSLSPFLKNLTYVTNQGIPTITNGSDFGGHPSLQDRQASYEIQESMHVHCGFAKGSRPGIGSGFDIDEVDLLDMEKCHGIIVVSAIFGNYDPMQQPKNISKQAIRRVCFFMFVDEETEAAIKRDDAYKNERKVGLWRIVTVHNLPFSDPRRTGKIPKLLLHRLFPNARFSLWIDGKLELNVDPYQILERFLWRTKDTFAISKHYRRFDVYVEAEANKAAGKYDNASIDAQVDFYRREGLTPYSIKKLPIISDVPEGCVIIREHTPITNLFTCLWFNEVDRFTSRDQISFAIVRDKIMAKVPWRINMFLDCERRNFVVQGYHRDILEQKMRLSQPELKATTANTLYKSSMQRNATSRSVIEEQRRRTHRKPARTSRLGRHNQLVRT